jgi:FAD/FMN-containing dehydrogenase
LDERTLSRLRAALDGAVLRPGEPDYEQARAIWNGMAVQRPALIVRVAGTPDTIACVNFARDQALALSIRGGGHNVAGTALCDGGLTIDMSRRRAVRVDPERCLVRVDPGATWGEVDRETQPHGLVVPSGLVSSTGVAGLTMGGGFGWTSRRFGFAADNLVSFDLVTADGQLRHVSATEHGELYWAVRGGGGNFGVVTSFEFRAHRLGPDVLCGMVAYPMAQTPDVISRLREVAAQAPDELCCALMLRHAPAAPFLPTAVHGRPIAAIAACWSGDPQAGEAALRPLRTLDEPLADTIGVKPFITHQTLLDASQPFGRRYYWKSHFLAEISDGLIETLVRHARDLPSPYSSILLTQLGGAPSRVDPAVNAVGARDAAHVVNFQAAWEDPRDDSRGLEWARACWSACRPFSTGKVYVNFMTDDEGEARLRCAYGDEVYARLRDIKTRWDPGNLFHGAQNIPPRQVAR